MLIALLLQRAGDCCWDEEEERKRDGDWNGSEGEREKV